MNKESRKQIKNYKSEMMKKVLHQSKMTRYGIKDFMDLDKDVKSVTDHMKRSAAIQAELWNELNIFNKMDKQDKVTYACLLGK